MNSTHFRRQLCRVIFHRNQDKYAGSLPQLLKRSMAVNVSRERMTERDTYNNALPGLIKNIVSNTRIAEVPELGVWLRKVYDYNIIGGNNSQGIVAMFTYNMLENPENITKENQDLAKVLGWCLETIHCWSCIVDDMIDDALMRRGAPCWYRIPNVGMGATNDAILMNCAITEILEMYFWKSPHFPHLIQLLHKAVLYIAMGQYLEALTIQKKEYTWKRYHDIVYYKTSYNSYKTPIELGLTLVKDTRNKINTETDPIYGNICFKLGKLFQMQNDYNDCYADGKTIGKLGSDIEEGKCTWLSVTALQRCSDSQRECFMKYYASKAPEHVAHIKALYNELNIPQIYKKEMTELHDDIVRSVHALPTETQKNFFCKLLNDLLLGTLVWGNTEISIFSSNSTKEK